jgi:hypothetical protein
VRRALLLSLAGSAILAAFSIAALPFSRGLFRAPRTPYDASDAQFTVPAWILLQRAEPLIPPGASVVVRVEPSDSNTDSYLHRFGVALLPGRRIVPAALWGVPTAPELLLVADCEIVVGATTSSTGRRLVLSTPEGSVWKRDR